MTLRPLLAVVASLSTAVSAQTSTTPPDAPPAPSDGPHRGPLRWGRLFISPMGEPFRGGDAPEARWFAEADTDHDGRIGRAEFLADAMRFFATLDIDHDRQIGSAEIDRYERDVIPEVGFGEPSDGGPPTGDGEARPADGGAGRRGHGGRGGMGARPPGGGMEGMGGPSGGMEDGGDRPSRGGRGGGGHGPPPAGAGGATGGYMFRASGAGRFGYLATPEPVSAADMDLDRVVTAKEFLAAAGRRFDLLDANGDGVIEARELPKLAGPGFGHRGRRPRRDDDTGPPDDDGGPPQG